MRKSLMVSAALLTVMVLTGRSVVTGPSVPSADVVEVLAMATPPPQPPAPVTVAAAPSASSGSVTISTADGGSFEIAAEIASQVQELFDDAAADGFVLGGWGLRSHQRQHELRKENRCPDDGSWAHTEGEDPSSWASASACETPTARPGFSNHESGLAIDITYNGSVIPARESPAFRWLAANAGRYGLENLPSEPWHWSVNGR